MAKTQAPQQQQAAPGSLFRVPGYGVSPRIVQEVGPCPLATSVTLQAATQVQAPFQKFQTLDIVRGYLLELDYAINFEKDAGADAITISQWAPLNLIQNIQVQFESAYSTYHATGIIAWIHQSYRPMFAPKSPTGQGFNSGAGSIPANALGSTEYSNVVPLATPNLALVAQTNASGTVQSFKMFLEVPTSMYFDLYYDLDANGRITGTPFHRATVSPSYMAATTRSVTPAITFNALQSVTDTLNSPYSASTSGHAGAVGAGGAKVNLSWYRDCWIPGTDPTLSPPVFGWQASLDYLTIQPNQAQQVPITLDNSVIGQGQILSLFFFCWDPTLNGGVGGLTPIASYNTVELLYGSTVQIRQQAPQENMYEWASQHTYVLPQGCFGWDLALTREGLLTNENALNSLVQAGLQVRINYVTGSTPAAASTIYVAVETLKKVGS